MKLMQSLAVATGSTAILGLTFSGPAAGGREAHPGHVGSSDRAFAAHP